MQLSRYDACVGFVNADGAIVAEGGVHSGEDLDNHRFASVNRRLFEEQLEAFIAAQPFSRGEFVDACQDALDASGDGGGGGGAAGFAASVVETVLMGSQYEYFVQTMAAAAAHDRQRRELGVDTVTVLDGAVAEAQAAGEGDEAAPEPEQLTQIPLPAAE